MSRAILIATDFKYVIGINLYIYISDGQDIYKRGDSVGEWVVIGSQTRRSRVRLPYNLPLLTQEQNRVHGVHGCTSIRYRRTLVRSSAALLYAPRRSENTG